MSPVKYDYQDERADNLRPRIARFLGWLRSYAEPTEELDAETIVGIYLAALAEKLGLENWRMDTFRDRAEMAKISVAYLLEGGINCTRILNIFEYAVDGFDAFQADPDGFDAFQADPWKPDTRVLTVEEMVEAIDRYLNGEPQHEAEGADAPADHLQMAVEGDPILGLVFLLGYERLEELFSLGA